MGYTSDTPGTKKELQEWLMHHFSTKLGIKYESIELSKPFVSYGLSSIVAVEMTGEIGEKFNIQLSPTLFYQYSNFISLSEYLAHLLFKTENKNGYPGIDLSSNHEDLNLTIEPWLEKEISQLLHLPRKKIHRELSFESLGIDLIISGVLSDKITSKFGFELSPNTLLEVQTIASLSQVLYKELKGRQQEKISSDTDSITHSAEQIAIVGMSCRFPGAPNPESFWETLIQGKCPIRKVPEGRWPKMGNPEEWETISHGAFLDNIEDFDPRFFGIAPREAEFIDPQQRLLLEVSWEALENAGIPPDSKKGKSVGVFVGISSNDYARLGSDEEPKLCAWSGTGNALSIAANRISYFLDFKGPSMSIDTACSSSLVAIHQAVISLQAGECELALAGGVNILNHPNLSLIFFRAGMLAPDCRCKTFDAEADGYVRGEGAGMIALKRMSKAVEDGDHVLAIIQGSAVNHDGSSNGLTAPNGLSQTQVVRRAMNTAELKPSDIGYIECHGTGTSLGDPIEVEALAAIHNNAAPDQQPCYLGAVKSNIGHLESAAGIAGLIKTILILQHKQIPPNLHFSRLNERILLASSSLKIASTVTSWKSFSGQPLYAGVSSFGFGGTNAHIILTDYPVKDQIEQENNAPLHLLKLSAKTTDGLRKLSQSYSDWLQKNNGLSNLFHTANIGRTNFAHRIVLSAKNAKDAIQQLHEFALNKNPESIIYGQTQQNIIPKIAFLFTGQDSQYLKMGKELFETQSYFKKILTRCDKIYNKITGESILDVLFAENDEKELIHQTEYSQPVLFALEYSLDKLVKSWGIRPDFVMGHSLGEFSAACSSGVLSLEEGMRFVALRGKLMSSLNGSGKMLVVFASEKKVVKAILQYPNKLAIAAANGPNHMVISGDKDAIKSIADTFATEKIRTRIMKLSHGFHSPMMQPIVEEYTTLVKSITFDDGDIPIISNLLAKPVMEELKIPEYWVRQMLGPVRFKEGIQVLEKQNVDIFVEIGPTPTLISMGKNCIDEGNHIWIPSLRRGQSNYKTMYNLLGQLYIHGVDVNWKKLEQTHTHQLVSAPTYPFQRSRYWSGIAENSNANPKSSPAYISKLGGHPLLGQRMHSPAFSNGEIVYTSLLKIHHYGFLGDHRIFGKAVLPTSAYIELVLAAAKEIIKSKTLSIREIRFMQAMLLSEETELPLQFILYPEGKGTYKFKIFSAAIGDNSTKWNTHAMGIVSAKEVAGMRAEIFELENPEELNIVKHYQYYHSIGMEYGPNFRGIEQLWKSGNQVMGRIWLPDKLNENSSDYQLHPALLDASMQIIAAMFHDVDSENAFLPVGIEEFSFFRRAGSEIWSCATVNPMDEGDVLLGADLDFFDEDGSPIASIKGLTLKKTSKSALELGFKESVQELLYQEEWKILETASIQNTQKLPVGTWWIFAKVSDIGIHDFCKMLAEKNRAFIIITPGEDFIQKDANTLEIDPSKLNHIQSIFEQTSFLPDNILYLWGMDDAQANDVNPDELEKYSKMIYLPLIYLARHEQFINNPKLRPSFWLLTQGVTAAGEDRHVTSLKGAPLWGMFRTMHLEIPNFKGAIIDLDPNVTKATYSKILLTCSTIPSEQEFAIRDWQVYVPRLLKSAPLVPDKDFKIRSDAVYIITGGLGYLGLNICEWLVEKGARFIMLCGRSKAEAPAVKRLEKLRSVGATISTKQVDIANRDEVKNIFLQQDGWPEIKGVVHAAGLIAFHPLEDMTDIDFTSLLRPKITGAWCLHQATKEMNLDFFCSFSSISSVWGSKEQIHYAAANSYLDAFSRYRRNLGLAAQTINWGPWLGGGMITDVAEEQLKDSGIIPISKELGMNIFDQFIGSNMPQIVAVRMDWQRFLDLFQMSGAGIRFENIPIQDSDRAEERKVNRELIKQLSIADTKTQYKLVLDYLRKTIGEVIKINYAEVDIHQSLIPMGMDSLMAMEIKNKIEDGMDIEIDPTLFLQDLTVDQLCQELVSRLDYSENKELNGVHSINANTSEDTVQTSEKEVNGALREFTDQNRLVYPLSQSQRAIYFAYQSDTNSSAYNVAFSATIRSGLNTDTLKNSFNKLVHRHSSLRTQYFYNDGEPLQEIKQSQNLKISEIMASKWSEEQVMIRIKEDYNQAIDLEKGPVLRVSLYHRGKDHFVLLFVVHHISCDAWSLMLLLEELEELYTSESENRNAQLGSLQWQYMDYVRAQNEYLKSDGFLKLKKYWFNKLSTDHEGTQIPLDHPRSQVITFNGSSIHFKLPLELHSRLKAMAKEEKVTLFIVLLAAFNVLLYKYTGANNIQIATSDAGRVQNKWRKIVGHFVNLLVLRSDIAGTFEFRQLVQQLKHSFLQDFSHKDFPFPMLVKELKVPRVPSIHPLVQIIFSMLRIEVGNKIQELQKPGNTNMKTNWAGMELEHFPMSQQEGQFDLTLNLIEDSHGISGTIKFNTDLFKFETINRMVGHYRTILEQVVQNSSLTLFEIPYVTPQENREELTIWNSTVQSEATEPELLHNIFQKHVLNFPKSIAIICGDERITYANMNIQVNRLAHYLIELGAHPELIIGVLLDRSIEAIVTIMAIMKSGAAYLPLDPTFPKKRILHMAEDSGIQLIVSMDAYSELIPKHIKRTLKLDLEKELIDSKSEKNPNVKVQVEDLVYVLYTSGSTGLPKGVEIEHRHLSNYHKAIVHRMNLDEGMNFVSPASLNADHIYTIVFGALCTGGTLHILSYDVVMDPNLMGEYFRTYRVDCLKITPSYLNALLTIGLGDDILPEKHLIVGGESFTKELWGKLKSLKPKCLVYNHYGPTETTIGSAFYNVDFESENNKVATVPIGSPLPNSKIYLLNSAMQLVPRGMPGEIYIGGISVARNYHNNSKLSNERIIKDPFSDRNRAQMYKTGDLARRLPDGNLEYLGRMDKQVKIRGYRVEPEEAKVALEEFDGITQALVITKSNDTENVELIAYVVPDHAKEELNTSLVMEFLRDRLPVHLVPSILIVLEKIPLNATGKIDYKALPEKPINNAVSENKHIGARNENEQKLLDIWQQVLKIKNIDIYDSFFQLGGDSINGLQIISKARAVGLIISVRQVFEHPTIAELATVADVLTTENSTFFDEEGKFPLTPIQEWFFKHYSNSPHSYNQSIVLKTKESLSPEKLLEALNLLIDQHKSLKIRFRNMGDNWEQYYDTSTEKVQLKTEDIQALSDVGINAKIYEVSRKFHDGLNISNGPILKACLFSETDDHTSYMLIVVHHIIIDAVSWSILMEDLNTIYKQLSNEEKITLPIKSNSYKTWALQQEKFALSYTLKDELAYWSNIGKKPLVKLPVDYSVAQNSNIFLTEKQFDCHLTKKLTNDLLNNSSSAYNTQVTDLMLVAISKSFNEWTNDSNLLVLMEGHGREDVFGKIDLSRSVGWFTTKYPVLLTSDKEFDSERAIISIKEQIRQISGKGIEYGILRYLSKDQKIRDEMTVIPQPEVVFNFLGKLPTHVADEAWEIQNQFNGVYRGSQLVRQHQIEIIGMVTNHELHFQWLYQSKVHKQSTIVSVATRFIEILTELVNHCIAQEKWKFTPSDFPTAGLDKTQLDNLLSKFKAS